jgi:hypothetical protein
VALGESFLIKRGGWEVDDTLGTEGLEGEALVSLVVEGDILVRFARGELD